MVNAIVRWLLSFILKIFDYILGIFLSIISPTFSSGFASFVNNASNYLQNFWGYMMRYFMYIRAIADINTFEMGLIVELLTITLLHKPIIMGVKLFIRWYKNMKL